MKQKDPDVELEERSVFDDVASADATSSDSASGDIAPTGVASDDVAPADGMSTDVAPDEAPPVDTASTDVTPDGITPAGRVEFAAATRAALPRIRANLTPDRLLAALCVVTVLVLAAPWVNVPVVQLVGRNVTYSVPDMLATGQVVVDRAQSFQDLADHARQVANRAADIVDRAQNAVERAQDAGALVSNAPEGKG